MTDLTPDRGDYLVMLSAQVERSLGRNSPAFLYNPRIGQIDTGGLQPERKPPGLVYDMDSDRWMPKAWKEQLANE